MRHERHSYLWNLQLTRRKDSRIHVLLMRQLTYLARLPALYVEHPMRSCRALTNPTLSGSAAQVALFRLIIQLLSSSFIVV